MAKRGRMARGLVGSSFIRLTPVNRGCELVRRRRNQIELILNTGRLVWSRFILRERLREHRFTRIDYGLPGMRASIVTLWLLILVCGVSAQKKQIIIAASTVLDGKGGVLHDTRIVVEGSRIVRIDPNAAPVDYDLRGLTVLPGWIDSHVHISWSFGPDGRNVNSGGTTQEAVYQTAANAWATLMAGFTTVQSVGSALDAPLRDCIAKGQLPGPRIITSLEPLMGQGEKTGTPDEIRAWVRKQKQAGADLIKIFASGGMRQNGMTLSQEQLNAACDEGKKLGLRTLVHAYRDAVRASTVAGCTQVEHGLGATDDDLKLMAQKGTYFDPQAGLLLKNYLENKEKFVGTPYFPKTLEGFAPMEQLIPMNHDVMQRAAKVSGLKIVFGSDAVAGMHGGNAEEFVERVHECGVEPMTAMVSANSVAAEALRMSEQIGTISRCVRADSIALDVDPLKDMTVVRRVLLVMNV